MPGIPPLSSSSFRDPDGFVFRDARGGVFRQVYPSAIETLRDFAASELCGELLQSGRLSPFRLLRDDLVEHQPIAFANFPWEWAPPMLHAAAGLTLQLAEESLPSGFLLKDATPLNIMFEGSRPVFLDLLSFTKDLAAPERIWRPYAQFVQTFLYPLLANAHAGLRLDEIFAGGNREGLDADRLVHLLPLWRLWTPPLLSLVTLPAMASSTATAYTPEPARDREEANYIRLHLLRRLSRLLSRIGSETARQSSGTAYMETDCPYQPREFDAKLGFVREAVRRERCSRVLDAGCNTGEFSLAAAAEGAQVVAIDHDEAAIGALWQRANAAKANVLPLVVNLARPTAAMGWENQETPSFLARAEGSFDCVLMLGLVHHLLVTERVPLDRILQLAARLTTRVALIEYVAPEDPQFVKIARGRDALHRDLTVHAFEQAAAEHFAIIDRAQIHATRIVYVLEKRSA